jgi:hypothetical protein
MTFLAVSAEVPPGRPVSECKRVAVNLTVDSPDDLKALRHGVPTAADSSMTADGAEWIWDLAADLFPDSVQVVDWYHACEHLAKAPKALYPDDASAAQRWYHARCTELYKGEIHKITVRLATAGLTEHAHYFHTHKRPCSAKPALKKAILSVLAPRKVASSSSRLVSLDQVCAGVGQLLRTCRSFAAQ